MIKRVVSISLLIIAVVTSTLLLNVVLGSNGDADDVRVRNFLNEPEDSLDVVMMGASDVFTGVSAGLVYKDTGIKSFPYSVSGCPVTLWEFMIKNIEASQKNALIVVDINGAAYDSDMLSSGGSTHCILDPVQFQYGAKLKTLDKMSQKRSYRKKAAFLLPYIKYHSSYLNYPHNITTYFSLQKEPSPLKGMKTDTVIYKNNGYNLKGREATEDKMELDPVAEECLIDFLDYCKENDKNVVFVRFPSFVERDEENVYYISNCRMNTASEIIQEYGFDFYNMQAAFDEIGINEKTDFYNPGHLNVYGQKKATRYLEGILTDKLKGSRPGINNKEIQEEWEKASLYYDYFYAYCDKRIKKEEKNTLSDRPSFVKLLGEDKGR